jgi:hypothetical protein
MLAIIISACLVADPGTCRDYRVPLDMGIDPTSCAMHAPPHFAQWADEHPGWRIVKWHCSTKNASDI